MEKRLEKNLEMKSVLSICFVALFLPCVNAALQNCTAPVCDLKTCKNTSSNCVQFCYSKDCKMSCTSSAGCYTDCVNGGCSKLACKIDSQPSPTGHKPCQLMCNENCPDIECFAHFCFPICRKSNCKMTCDGGDEKAECYPKCHGGGCSINVKSFYTETSCLKGSCTVKFSNATKWGSVNCPGGNCSLTCATGNICVLRSPCPNCTGPVYVDDPFASGISQGSIMTSTSIMSVICALSAFMLPA